MSNANRRTVRGIVRLPDGLSDDERRNPRGLIIRLVNEEGSAFTETTEEKENDPYEEEVTVLVDDPEGLSQDVNINRQEENDNNVHRTEYHPNNFERVMVDDDSGFFVLPINTDDREEVRHGDNDSPTFFQSFMNPRIPMPEPADYSYDVGDDIEDNLALFLAWISSSAGDEYRRSLDDPVGVLRHLLFVQDHMSRLSEEERRRFVREDLVNYLPPIPWWWNAPSGPNGERAAGPSPPPTT